MITKPEDAVPRFAVINPPFSIEEKTAYPMFTAAECAEIARAYARSIATEARATWMSESKHEIAREELNAWRAKLAEWEKGQ